tara:strand:+ start:370 stop:561 length:192 start_codon:yes stop_codon:yes gene_type:complete
MIGQTAVSARGGKRAGRAMDVGLAPFVAAVLGLFILYGVGFAQPAFLHEAAHDTRHAFTFPCH